MFGAKISDSRVPFILKYQQSQVMWPLVYNWNNFCLDMVFSLKNHTVSEL